MSKVQILGRRFSLGPVLRMSGEEGPPPLATWEEYPDNRGVAFEDHAGGGNIDKYLAPHAMMEGRHKITSTGHGSGPGYSFYNFLVADPQGNVTRHHSGRVTERPTLQAALRAAFPGHKMAADAIDYSGDVETLDAEDPAVIAAHKRAIAEGRLVGKSGIHPELLPHMKAAHAAQMEAGGGSRHFDFRTHRNTDKMPQWVLADFLDDRGHAYAARGLRRRLDEDERMGERSFGPMRSEHLFEYLTRNESHHADDQEKKDQIHREVYGKEPEHRYGLRFGPALPFRSRSYHPKPRSTDLKEAEWGRISRFFPVSEMGPKTRRTPIRTLLNATMFRLENGLSLRDMEAQAPDLPPWGSCHALEFRISEAGLWPTIIRAIGRDYLLERLPKLIRSAGEMPGGMLGRPTSKVRIEGLPTEPA